MFMDCVKSGEFNFLNEQWEREANIIRCIEDFRHITAMGQNPNNYIDFIFAYNHIDQNSLTEAEKKQIIEGVEKCVI